jgi:hypothetical protein
MKHQASQCGTTTGADSCHSGAIEDPTMKNDYIVAGILVGAMVVGLGGYSAHPNGQ